MKNAFITLFCVIVLTLIGVTYFTGNYTLATLLAFMEMGVAAILFFLIGAFGLSIPVGCVTMIAMIISTIATINSNGWSDFTVMAILTALLFESGIGLSIALMISKSEENEQTEDPGKPVM